MINTLLVILEQMLLHLPLMLGAYISFSLLKVPDLSIETAYVFGALIGSKVLVAMHGMPLGITLMGVVCASLIGGAMVGLVSSLMTQKAHLPHLLSSIITFGIFHGINQFISAPYVSLHESFNPLTILPSNQAHPELVTLAFIGCMVTLLVYFLFKTQLGYSFAVYGNNPHFFSNYGISTTYIFISGVMLSNALAGLSGYMFAQSNSFVEINMGLGKALLCITALILGKAIFKTKKPFSIMMPIVGTAAYFALQQLLLKVGFNLKYFTALQAIIVLIILVYTYRTKTTHAHIDNLGV